MTLGDSRRRITNLLAGLVAGGICFAALLELLPPEFAEPVVGSLGTLSLVLLLALIVPSTISAAATVITLGSIWWALVIGEARSQLVALLAGSLILVGGIVLLFLSQKLKAGPAIKAGVFARLTFYRVAFLSLVVLFLLVRWSQRLELSHSLALCERMGMWPWTLFWSISKAFGKVGLTVFWGDPTFFLVSGGMIVSLGWAALACGKVELFRVRWLLRGAITLGWTWWILSERHLIGLVAEGLRPETSAALVECLERDPRFHGQLLSPFTSAATWWALDSLILAGGLLLTVPLEKRPPRDSSRVG